MSPETDPNQPPEAAEATAPFDLTALGPPPSLAKAPGVNPQNFMNDPAYKKSMAETQQHIEETGARADELMGQRRSVVNAVAGDVLSGLRGIESMRYPQMEKAPKEPSSGELSQGMMQWMQAATVLAALGGAFARGNATTALNAFAGAVKGFSEGRKQDYEAHVQEWKEASQRIKEDNQARLDAYNDIMKRREFSIQQKLGLAKVVAGEYGDEIGYNLTEQGHYVQFAQFLERSQRDQANFAMQQQRLENTTRDIDSRIASRGAGGGGRSSRTMYANQWRQENPDASSQEFAKAMAKYDAQQRAVTAFSTGMQGRQINSLNVAVSHLEVLADLGKALENKDTRLFNELSQTWSAQTGNAAPSNFDTAKDIVGGEIMKALIAGGGGQTERQELRSAFDKVHSPEQIAGAIEVAERLLAGQFSGFKKQYEGATGFDDFDDKISEEALPIFQKWRNAVPGKKETKAPADSGTIKYDAEGNRVQ